jgi:hypothetical protein
VGNAKQPGPCLGTAGHIGYSSPRNNEDLGSRFLSFMGVESAEEVAEHIGVVPLIDRVERGLQRDHLPSLLLTPYMSAWRRFCFGGCDWDDR